MNFNIVKKNKKEEEFEEEEEDIELEEEKVKPDNSKAKKRMITFMIYIIVGTIILLFILYLVSLLNTKNYAYEDVETVLKNAAESYFKDHPESLPLDEGNIVEIDSSNLVAEEKMKDLSEYVRGDVACTGVVQVEKSGEQYMYTPYLNCGESYTTRELVKKVLEDNDRVTTGYGLYTTGSGYSFRGEDVKNYVKLDNSLWRIVKITGNDNIVLITDKGVSYTQPWDNRYNETRFYESGINQYSASRIKEYLEKIYEKPSVDDGEAILSDNDKTKIVSFNACTGKRSIDSEAKDNSIECLEVLKEQKISLLTLSDYMYASIDPNCKNSTHNSCKNYNYLAKIKNWWLITANQDDNSTVFCVNQSGSIKNENASNYSQVRPIIYLNNRVMYKTGDGSYEKPYEIK